MASRPARAARRVPHSAAGRRPSAASTARRRRRHAGNGRSASSIAAPPFEVAADPGKRPHLPGEGADDGRGASPSAASPASTSKARGAFPARVASTRSKEVKRGPVGPRRPARRRSRSAPRRRGGRAARRSGLHTRDCLRSGPRAPRSPRAMRRARGRGRAPDPGREGGALLGPDLHAHPRPVDRPIPLGALRASLDPAGADEEHDVVPRLGRERGEGPRALRARPPAREAELDETPLGEQGEARPGFGEPRPVEAGLRVEDRALGEAQSAGGLPDRVQRFVELEGLVAAHEGRPVSVPVRGGRGAARAGPAPRLQPPESACSRLMIAAAASRRISACITARSRVWLNRSPGCSRYSRTTLTSPGSRAVSPFLSRRV